MDDFRKKFDAAVAPFLPRVSFKKFTASEALSEETLAFHAIVLWDGAPLANASNDGHGGEPRLWPLHGQAARLREAEAAVWAKAAGLHIGLDAVVDAAAERHRAAAQMARWCKTTIVFDVGAGRFYKVKHPVLAALFRTDRAAAAKELAKLLAPPSMAKLRNLPCLN